MHFESLKHPTHHVPLILLELITLIIFSKEEKSQTNSEIFCSLPSLPVRLMKTIQTPRLASPLLPHAKQEIWKKYEKENSIQR
jgi:hypothetical protein